MSFKPLKWLRSLFNSALPDIPQRIELSIEKLGPIREFLNRIDVKEECDLYGSCNIPGGCWWCTPKSVEHSWRRWATEASHSHIDNMFFEQCRVALEQDRNRPIKLHDYKREPCTCESCRLEIAGYLVRKCPASAKRWFQAHPGMPILLLDDLGHVSGSLDPNTLRPLGGRPNE